MDRNWMFVAVVAGILYAVVIYKDLFYREIPNTVSVLTCILAGVRWWFTGDLAAFVVSLVLAVACFAGMTVLFLRGLVGGGDVKLLAASLLLIGSARALPFLLLMTVVGGLLALAILLVRRLQSSASGDPATVPYGVAIAASGFWTLISDHAVMSM